MTNGSDASAQVVEKKMEMRLADATPAADAEQAEDATHAEHATDAPVATAATDVEQSVNKFAEALKADGYLKDGKLAAEFKKGGLTINGEKQSADVVKKYENFLPAGKDFSFSISTEKK